jgi:hypothetical protein
MKGKRKLLRVKMPFPEYEHLVKERAKSPYRSMTEYVRKRLSGDPVVIFYRNVSFDEFINEAILLREGLEEMRSKFQLSGQNDEAFINLMLEIKDKIDKLFDHVCKDQSIKQRQSHIAV